MKGLLIALGPKKPDGKGEKKPAPSGFDKAADEAFDAATKDGDREGFRAALKLAIRACMDGYDE